jgi:Tol biopolymer transport system component
MHSTSLGSSSRHPCTRLPRFRPVSALVAAVGLASAAHAGLTEWTAVRGGDFWSSRAWSNGVPAPGDAASFGAVASGTPFVVTSSLPIELAQLSILNQSPIFTLTGPDRSLTAGELLVQSAATPIALTLDDADLAAGQVTLAQTQASPTTASLTVRGGSSATYGSLAVRGTTGSTVASSLKVDGGALAASGAASTAVIADGGAGELLVVNGGSYALNGSTLQLGQTGGAASMVVGGGSTLSLGGGNLRVAGSIPAPGTAGSATLTVAGTIEGPGKVLVSPGSSTTSKLVLEDGAVVHAGIEQGFTLSQTLASGIVALDGVTFVGSGPATFTASGAGSEVAIGAVTFATGSPSMTATTGASLVIDTLTGTNGSLQLRATGGADIAVLESFAPGTTTSLSECVASGAGSTLSLPGVVAKAGSPLRIGAELGGSIVVDAMISPLNGRASLTSLNASSVTIQGPLSLEGAGSNSNAPAIDLDTTSSLSTGPLVVGSAARLRLSMQSGTVQCSATSVIFKGTFEMLQSSWQPSVGTDVQLLSSPSVEFAPKSLILPTFFGHQPLLYVNATGLRARVIDSIQSFDLPSSLSVAVGQTITVPTVVTAGGVTVDASDQVTWTFAPPIVQRTGPRTFIGVAPGDAIATVKYGTSTSTTTVPVSVTQPIAPSVVLASGSPIAWGNADSGASPPIPFETVDGLRPRCISADGDLVAFSTSATNVAPGVVAANTWNVVLRSLDQPQAQLVSTTATLGLGTAEYGAVVTPDGRYVAYSGNGAAPNFNRVFVLDRDSNLYLSPDVSTDGGPPNGSSFEPRISDDGRYVLFESLATNLVADDTNGVQDVFLRDLVLGVTTRVSVAIGGAQLNVASKVGDLSPDGAYAAFLRPTGGWTLAYRYDRANATVELATPGLSDTTPQIHVLRAQLSQDGRYLTFLSTGLTQLTEDPNPPQAQVYRRDLDTGVTVGMSTTAAGTYADSPVFAFAADADATRVVFTTMSTNLVPGTPNAGLSMLFAKDLETGSVWRLSTGPLRRLQRGACPHGRPQCRRHARGFRDRSNERDSRRSLRLPRRLCDRSARLPPGRPRRRWRLRTERPCASPRGVGQLDLRPRRRRSRRPHGPRASLGRVADVSGGARKVQLSNWVDAGRDRLPYDPRPFRLH